MRDIDHKTTVPAPVGYGNEILVGEQLYVAEGEAQEGDVILAYEDGRPVWIGRVYPNGLAVDQYDKIHKPLPETYRVIQYVLHRVSWAKAVG